eukprot:4003214-Lingulodinium_polyedra.AAC.1
MATILAPPILVVQHTRNQTRARCAGDRPGPPRPKPEPAARATCPANPTRTRVRRAVPCCVDNRGGPG